MITVQRARPRLGSRPGLTTLEQRFLFEGPGATATAIISVLRTARLIGAASVFGDRPGVEGTSGESRTLRLFSPAPGFRFDVEFAAPLAVLPGGSRTGDEAGNGQHRRAGQPAVCLRAGLDRRSSTQMPPAF